MLNYRTRHNGKPGVAQFLDRFSWQLAGRRHYVEPIVVHPLHAFIKEINTSEPRASDLRRKRMADLPMMTEWIDDAAKAPTICFLHRDDLLRTCGQCLREHRIRIRHGQDHPN